MKRLIFTFLLSSVFFISYAGSGAPAEIKPDITPQSELSPENLKMGLEEFLALTPKKYKEKTGKKLGFANTLKLKAAQKVIKKKMRKPDADISKGVYILLAIFGLGWLALGLLSDFEGNDWWVNLILTFLCWLPGLIHALIKMKDYY